MKYLGTQSKYPMLLRTMIILITKDKYKSLEAVWYSGQVWIKSPGPMFYYFLCLFRQAPVLQISSLLKLR